MSQKFSTEITVGNNLTVGFDKVALSTTCHGFVELNIPNYEKTIELKRKELIDFLLRTQPEFSVNLRVSAELPDLSCPTTK